MTIRCGCVVGYPIVLCDRQIIVCRVFVVRPPVTILLVQVPLVLVVKVVDHYRRNHLRRDRDSSESSGSRLQNGARRRRPRSRSPNAPKMGTFDGTPDKWNTLYFQFQEIAHHQRWSKVKCRNHLFASLRDKATRLGRMSCAT